MFIAQTHLSSLLEGYTVGAVCWPDHVRAEQELAVLYNLGIVARKCRVNGVLSK